MQKATNGPPIAAPPTTKNISVIGCIFIVFPIINGTTTLPFNVWAIINNNVNFINMLKPIIVATIYGIIIEIKNPTNGIKASMNVVNANNNALGIPIIT